MSVGVYTLTDQNDNTVLLFVPRFFGSERKPGNDNLYNIVTATGAFGEQFDHTATFFVTSQTVYDNMINQGFPHVILCSDYDGDIWTFDNGAYIEFTLSNAIYHGLIQGEMWPVAPTPSISDDAHTFVSDLKNLDWIPGVAGYYGALRQIGSNGFTCLYYPMNFLNEQSFEKVWEGLQPFVPDEDPYEEGGTSGIGGGTGTFSDTGDIIGIPALPSLSAVDAGFITLFNPSISQLASLASYMWSGAFDLNTFRKIFADPMDCILGLSIVPVNVPAGGSAEVQVGNIGTGVYMTTAARQYVEVDCGTLNVQEFWGGYLDYDPYTKAEIYLPYIGTHPIAVDDIMGKSVHVVYHLDILSGACIAYVQCGGTVLYSFIGQCSSSIPVTGNDWTNVVNGVLSIAGSIGSMVATGGASAPTAAASIASTAINSMKPSVEKSGALSGTGGMLGVQVPYLILTRPRQARPARQNTFIGYPSFITEDMGTLRGYTEIESVHLEGIPATPGEIDEIESILKGGVIF